jgi:glyoxylase-like metal-dependent hydrolase (beta-lactamase superfamily II)
MFLKQIKCKGDNFSYVIANKVLKEAVVVDPSFNAEAIIEFAKEQRLSINFIINTHGHRDHIASNGEIKSKLGSKIVAHKLSNIDKDMEVVEGDTLKVGGMIIEVIHTPGHSPDSICLLVEKKLFTGDTLFIGECGRTDLSEGSAADMYTSLFHKLMMLDEDIEVYPGHDYGSKPCSTIGEEKKTNYTLEKRSLREFIDFMEIP